jgi:4-alpha-glucanotransferase
MQLTETITDNGNGAWTGVVTLHLEYYTQWGEQIYVCIGGSPVCGRVIPLSALPMDNDGRGQWFLRLMPQQWQGKGYSYCVVRDGRVVRREWTEGHQLSLPVQALTEALASAKEQTQGVATPIHTALQIFDRWNDVPADLPFHSSAFTQSIFHTETTPDFQPAPSLPAGAPGTITFRCEAASVQPGILLGVCGNVPALGNWNPEEAAWMHRDGESAEWTVTVPHTESNFPIRYKFVFFDCARKVWLWEPDEDRTIVPQRLPAHNEVLWACGMQARNPMQPWRGAGVAIPVFSLRSHEDAGIGEFSDLKLLVDWAVQTGQRFIQILPVNDTTITRTWRDSYPYSSNSTFALNPIYIRLEEVGILPGVEEMEQFRRRCRQLNSLPMVDFEQVLELKWTYLRRIYILNGAADMATAEYQQFYEQNRYWLDDYAVFSYLRDKYHTANFNEWPEHQYSPELIQRLTHDDAPSRPTVGLYKFIQFHLHRQLSAVRNYAHSRGIVLKGDIPIGINRYSVDAWSRPTLFHMNSQAGAPPDAFDSNGQNWGFPTYNWHAMAAEGYRWFRERFIKMSEYFDAYRIDHILGFFRIWEVPTDAVQGLLGHFNPALPLTADEMQQLYGFTFDRKRHVQPYITDETLETLFDQDEELLETVKHKFLDIPLPGDEGYRFCPRFGSQRSVEGYFKNRPAEADLKRKLFGLLTELLFVEDPHSPGRFHPRINGMDTRSFAALSPEQQAAYRRLHEDFFYHRHTEFWRQEALRKLPVLLQATPMLACGEDLGMIPSCVPGVMHDLRILSLEIQRMPKGFEEFGKTQNYPYYSVCTTSSHDLSNLRAWWEEDPEQTQRYYRDVLQEVGTAPKQAQPWICAKILEQHLASPSMLAIFPLQDWLAIDGALRYPDPTEERINTPSNPDNYWRYRMHLPLEELLISEPFNRRIRNMIAKHGR